MVGGLSQQINVTLGQQQQVGPPVTVRVARSEGVGVQQPVVQRPAFGRAPAVGALIKLRHQFFRFAVIRDVRPGVPIQIRHHQTGNPLFRGDGLDAKPGVGRQFIQLAFGGRFRLGPVRFARLVVQQVYLRPKVIDDDQVLQSVTVQVSRAQMTDLIVDGKYLRAGERKAIRAAIGARQAESGQKNEDRAPNHCPARLNDLHRTAFILQPARECPRQGSLASVLFTNLEERFPLTLTLSLGQREQLPKVRVAP